MRVMMLTAVMLLGASAASAQQAQAPASATNSGVLKRVPLDQWMPERCPNPEQQGEVVVCGRPEEEAPPAPEPEPGERGTDVQEERAALIAPESAAPSTSCTAVGAAGEFGCNRAAIEQWKRERKLQKAREKANQPPDK